MGQGAEGGENVVEVTQGVGRRVCGNTGAGDDERDAQGVFVEILFSDETVAAASDARVGGENDERVARRWGGVERIKDAADELIEVARANAEATAAS